ncbi:ABC transporter substrate-binding protein [Rugosimonospora acidiphila]|uniref:ABC transporter substrate-binding protein n=1 Tax=Rugosimonospora acidiphila TaxID=556531 RepID=A0ABP9SDC1_9ACTN
MTRSSFIRPRAIALAVAAALAAGSLAGCSGKSSSDPNTLTVMSSFTTGDATGNEFNKLAKEFTAQTGIKINVEEVNYADLPKVYEAAKLANKEKDLVIENLTPDTTDWLPQGQVVDVKQYLDDWGLTDKLDPQAIEYWTQGDSGLAGFPYTGFNWPVWYNMDLLKKAGITQIPANTDELIADAGKLRAAGIQPMALGGAEWPVQNFVTWMVQQYVAPDQAKKLFSSGGYCANPGAVKGLDLMGRLRDAGVFIDNVQGYTADQMTTAYFTGKAAIMPSGSWGYTQVPDAVAATTKLAGFPVTAGGAYSKPTAFEGYSDGFFLSPNGAKKLASVEKFMKFMYSQQNLQSWVTDGSQIMDVKPEALGDAKSTKPLVVQGNALTKDVVDYLLLPDNYIPAGFDYSPVASEFLGHKGETGAQFCKALDKLYTDKK